ncbi:UNVERIFIED_CONTAM: hypothetical protein K2H54_043383 [Gekko kuhli]
MHRSWNIGEAPPPDHRGLWDRRWSSHHDTETDPLLETCRGPRALSNCEGGQGVLVMVLTPRARVSQCESGTEEGFPLAVTRSHVPVFIQWVEPERPVGAPCVGGQTMREIHAPQALAAIGIVCRGPATRGIGQECQTAQCPPPMVAGGAKGWCSASLGRPLPLGQAPRQPLRRSISAGSRRRARILGWSRAQPDHRCNWFSHVIHQRDDVYCQMGTEMIPGFPDSTRGSPLATPAREHPLQDVGDVNSLVIFGPITSASSEAPFGALFSTPSQPYQARATASKESEDGLPCPRTSLDPLATVVGTRRSKTHVLGFCAALFCSLPIASGDDTCGYLFE